MQLPPVTAEQILQLLNTDAFQIEVVSSASSTNSILKERAKDAALAEYSVLLTEHQTNGRGRLGKSFYSPGGCGLYFSLFLRPRFPAKDAVLITVCAACAVRAAVKATLGISAQIKWVNDLYVNNKKFCGILTESGLRPDGTLAYAVLGIGINLLPPFGGYPDEFAYKTTNLFDSFGTLPEQIKPKLLANILTEFKSRYQVLTEKRYLAEYKAASCVIGKEIEILSGAYKGRAFAKDIDGDANLIVTLPDGSEAALSSGDVSIHI